MTTYGDAEEILSRADVDAKEETWYQLRREGITATDIGALTGNSLYGKTAFTVYWTKVADLRTAPDRQMQAGTDWQETALRMAYAYGSDYYEGIWDGYDTPGLLRNTEDPWMLCSPDALVYEKDAGWVPLEIKTSAKYEGYGREGTDEIPADYRCQVAWQALIIGADHGYCAVLMPNHRMKIYCVDNRTAESYRTDWDWFYQTAAEFRENHLLPEVPPDIIGTGAELKVMKRVQQLDPEKTIECDDELASLIADVRHFRSSIRDYEEMAKKAEVRIRERMKEAKTVVDANGFPLLVRRVVKRSGYEVKPVEFEQLDFKKPRETT